MAVASRIRRINIRRTHPGLYHSIMTLGLTEIALAINFWTSTPTFNPYNISKNLIGIIFFILGAGQVLHLNFLRNLRLVRITLAASIAFTFAWGVANTQQSLAGRASWQLPIMYLALCILQIPLVIEAPINPMTEQKS